MFNERPYVLNVPFSTALFVGRCAMLLADITKFALEACILPYL